MGSDIKNWSDLELRLGNYTSKLKNQDEFTDVYYNIVDNLRDYLKTEQDNFDHSKCDKSVLLGDLVAPELVLSKKETNKITSWHEKWTDHIQLFLLTFNYTSTIERIINDVPIGSQVGSKINKRVFLRGIEHIHGYIGDELVLGVNDVEQIENEKLRLLQEVSEVIVKPSHNQELGHMRDDNCMEIISSANLIFIFGSSIGESDRMWWEKIAERLGENCRLVIFHRGGNVIEQNKIKNTPKNRKIINRFLSLTNLDEEQMGIAKEYISAAVTRDLFNLVQK